MTVERRPSLDPYPRRHPRPGTTRPGPSPAPRPAPAGDGLRVLYLGSSLTYANDMPAIVQGFAHAVGKAHDYTVVAKGGASFEDHWKRGDALRRIKEGGWSHVVLQQGPSTLPESRATMRRYARHLAGPIQACGARPLLYMVWPSRDRMAFFDDVRETYTLTAQDIGGMLAPAGEAWRAVWRRDPDAPLLKRDGEHPTALGSYVIALSIFGMLYARSPVGLPASIRLKKGTAEVPPEVAPLLQEAVAEANDKYGRR